LNLIVLTVLHQFLLPQPKSRSIFAPQPQNPSRAYAHFKSTFPLSLYSLTKQTWEQRRKEKRTKNLTKLNLQSKKQANVKESLEQYL